MKTFSSYSFSVCWVLTGCWVSALSAAALFNTDAWLLSSSHAGLVGGPCCCFPSSSFWSLDWLWHCRWMWQCSAHSGSLKDSAWLGSPSPCMHYVSRNRHDYSLRKPAQVLLPERFWASCGVVALGKHTTLKSVLLQKGFQLGFSACIEENGSVCHDLEM